MPNNPFARTASGRRVMAQGTGNKVVRGQVQGDTLNFVPSKVNPANSTGGPAANSTIPGATYFGGGSGSRPVPPI